MQEDELEDDIDLEDQETEIVDETNSIDAPGTAEDEDQEDLIFEADAENTEEEEPEEPAPLVRTLRKVAREKDKELRKLRQQVSELSGASATPQEEELGPIPRAVDFGFDEEQHVVAVLEWNKKAEKVRARIAEQKDQQNRANQLWESKKSGYETAKAQAIGKVADYEDVEELVTGKLNETQRGLVLAAAQKPTALIYSLGKDKKALEALAAIQEPILFVAEMARFELMRKGMATSSGRTAPERTVSGTGGGRVSDQVLARLEKEAERSGDRTKIIAYKRNLRDRKSARR
jgi:hypothetical protein